MKKVMTICAAVIAVGLTAACKSGIAPKNIDKAMLLGEWETVSAEEQSHSIDSNWYRYISLSVCEDSIVLTMHDRNGDPVPPLEIETRTIVGYSIDSNNVMTWGRESSYRPHEWEIIELTQERFVFRSEYPFEDDFWTETYTMKRH